jgi:hypothetical protein
VRGPGGLDRHLLDQSRPGTGERKEWRARRLAPNGDSQQIVHIGNEKSDHGECETTAEVSSKL